MPFLKIAIPKGELLYVDNSKKFGGEFYRQQKTDRAMHFWFNGGSDHVIHVEQSVEIIEVAMDMLQPLRACGIDFDYTLIADGIRPVAGTFHVRKFDIDGVCL